MAVGDLKCETEILAELNKEAAASVIDAGEYCPELDRCPQKASCLVTVDAVEPGFRFFAIGPGFAGRLEVFDLSADHATHRNRFGDRFDRFGSTRCPGVALGVSRDQ